MTEKDTYKTLSKASEEVLFKDKNSKFFGRAFPISSEEDIQFYLEKTKKKHRSAGHWCYAWQLGKTEEETKYRANDDGEPSNSAGMPIYGQIQSFGLTHVLIIITRYFGGVKLGVGGLIQAYKTTAKMALEGAEIIQKTIDVPFEIIFDYPEMNKVMRIIKENNLKVTHQILELNCRVFLSVRKKDASRIYKKFDALHKVDIKNLDGSNTNVE